MRYKALVTIDLPGATDVQRKEFYKELEKRNWEKLNKLTTAWKASKDGISRRLAIDELIRDLNAAKQISKVSKVEFAIQLDTEEVLVKSLN